MTLTVLATGLAEAVSKDEQTNQVGFDLSAGLFGEQVSEWLRKTAEELSGENRPADNIQGNTNPA
jgi:hypothetical protein